MPAATGASLQVWATRHPGARLRLSCAESDARAVEGETAVRLRTCLADVPLALGFELLDAGAESVALDVAGCTSPAGQRWSTRMMALAQALGLAERVVAASGGDPVEPLDADAMPVLQRRSLLGIGAAAGEVAPPVDARSDQRRLRDVARKLGRPEGRGPLGDALRIVARGCRANGVCVQVCPEDAITLSDGVLAYDPSLCTGCGACLESCDNDSLISAGPLPWTSLLSAPVILEDLGALTTCARCRDEFKATDGETLCPTCAFRQANPFGSHLPPGALAAMRRNGYDPS